MNRHTQYLLSCLISLFTCTSAYGLAKSLLRPATAPITSADFSFAEKIANATAGYEPFAGISAYHTIDLESEDEYMNRLVARAEQQNKRDLATMSPQEYCNAYPLDDKYCVQTPGLYESVVAIGDRPKPTTTTTVTTPATTTPATTTTTQQPTQDTVVAAQTQPQPQPQPQQQPQQQQQQPQPQPQPQQQQQATTITATGSVVGHDEFGRPVVSSKTIHDGPCTRPQRSNHFANKIYTSGQYAKSDPAFEKIMITTFRAEGNCANDPDDSGGYTCYGISQNNNPEIDVRNITRADAEQIANRKYYRAYNINTLPDYIRGDVFTFGWASGTITGIRHFCDVLRLPRRNKIDNELVRAAENYSGDLRNDYLDNMQQYFIRASKKGNNKKYLKGWMNRVKLTRESGCHEPTTNPLSR